MVNNVVSSNTYLAQEMTLQCSVDCYFAELEIEEYLQFSTVDVEHLMSSLPSSSHNLLWKIDNLLHLQREHPQKTNIHIREDLCLLTSISYHVILYLFPIPFLPLYIIITPAKIQYGVINTLLVYILILLNNRAV